MALPTDPPTFEYTLGQLAEAAGLAKSSVKALLKSYDGSKPLDFARLILSRVGKHARKLSPDELKELFVSQSVKNCLIWEARWESRYPLFDLYVCGFPSCSQTLLAKGLCEAHGGYPQIRISPSTAKFEVRVGLDWVPLHRVICIPDDSHGPGAHVVHTDKNPWNNRPDNLWVVSHETWMRNAELPEQVPVFRLGPKV